MYIFSVAGSLCGVLWLKKKKKKIGKAILYVCLIVQQCRDVELVVPKLNPYLTEKTAYILQAHNAVHLIAL